ncbi:hypothetical protein IL306_000484 [Fusarium sp. DS 682]|nr:hypothetical protein IL306_000484 [Fusarium sp. DS 682]
MGNNDVDMRMRLREDIVFNMKVFSDEQTCGVLPARARHALTRLLHQFGFNDIVNNPSAVPSSYVYPQKLLDSNYSLHIPCRHTEGDAGEVSGPPEAFYLSDLAPFRRAYDDAAQNSNRSRSVAGSLASSSQNLTQHAPVLRNWNQQATQMVNPSVMPGNQVLPLVDHTQFAAGMPNEITWDLFSLPDWVFDQQNMDFGA